MSNTTASNLTADVNFEQRANEARALADRTKDPAARRMLLRLASLWDQLARRLS